MKDSQVSFARLQHRWIRFFYTRDVKHKLIVRILFHDGTKCFDVGMRSRGNEQDFFLSFHHFDKGAGTVVFFVAFLRKRFHDDIDTLKAFLFGVQLEFKIKHELSARVFHLLRQAFAPLGDGDHYILMAETLYQHFRAKGELVSLVGDLIESEIFKHEINALGSIPQADGVDGDPRWGIQG